LKDHELGGSLKSREEGIRPLYKVRPSLCLPFFVFFLSLSFLASWAFAEMTPVWTFDFRDVFYDIAFLNE